MGQTRILDAMRSRLWRLALVTLLAGYALTVAVSSSAGRLGNVARALCGPDSARTLAGDAVARVYASGSSAYGCVAGGTRSYRLEDRIFG